MLHEQATDLAAIENILSDIRQHQERVAGVVASATSAALLVLVQTSDAIPAKIQQMQSRCSRISSTKAEVNEKATKHSQLFVKCSSVTQTLSAFGQECQSILSELEFLQGEFNVYKANISSNVFTVLATTSNAWKRFAIAYDEMILELSRRRLQLLRTQEIVDAYQRELDLLHDQEVRERKRFEELYMKDFPQSWWSAVPGLSEASPQYTVHPPRITSTIPDFGIQGPLLHRSLTSNRASSGSSSVQLATSSTTTPPLGSDSTANLLLSSSVTNAPPTTAIVADATSLYRSAQDWIPDSTIAASLARTNFPSLDQSQTL